VRSRRLAALAALALLTRPSAATADEWLAPPEARARPNPVAAEPSALAKGRALYQRHCTKCHGTKGRGDGPAARYGASPASDLTVVKESLTDGEVFWKVTTGRKVGPEVIMPAFARDIPQEDDRWKLALYLRALLDEAPRPN
jgi:mono/diheme cytochrome c family protein